MNSKLMSADEKREHTQCSSVPPKLLHSYRANFENPKINLGEFSELFSLFILKYFAS